MAKVTRFGLDESDGVPATEAQRKEAKRRVERQAEVTRNVRAARAAAAKFRRAHKETP